MSALLSLATGLATTAASLTIVLVFVAGFAGTRLFGRIQHLISPLLSVPHAAAAFGLAFLIAPSGMIARMLSPELTGWERPPDLLIVNDPMGLAMTTGLIVKEIPFLLLITLAALPQVDLARSRLLAASLGYGRIAGFVLGPWPPIYRQVRLAVFAVLAFSTSVVDVAVILGPTTPAPLAVRLTAWMNDPELSMRFLASAGALLQLGRHRCGAADLDRHRTSRRMAAGQFRRRRQALPSRPLGWQLPGWAPCCFPLPPFAAGLPCLACGRSPGCGSFPTRCLPKSPDRHGCGRRHASSARSKPRCSRRCFRRPSLPFSRCCVWSAKDETGRTIAGRGALALIYLPLIVPQVAFLFGLQLLFILGGAAGLPSLVLAHLVFVLPYVFLSLSDPWRAYDRRYEAVAAGFGKSRLTTLLRVRLPMLLRAVLTAAAVGFAVSIGQYLPTLLIGAGRLTTITTEAVALAVGRQPPA